MVVMTCSLGNAQAHVAPAGTTPAGQGQIAQWAMGLALSARGKIRSRLGRSLSVVGISVVVLPAPDQDIEPCAQGADHNQQDGRHADQELKQVIHNSSSVSMSSMALMVLAAQASRKNRTDPK